MNNRQYLRVFTAFQLVGEMTKEGRSPRERSKIGEAYEHLKHVLKDGAPTIGDAMIARGLRKEADFTVRKE